MANLPSINWHNTIALISLKPMSRQSQKGGQPVGFFGKLDSTVEIDKIGPLGFSIIDASYRLAYVI
jgi:hypothetical protein